jgi:GNAT superfamily N-acetyltransferase
VVRRATIEDLDEILRITRPYFEESIWGTCTRYSEQRTREEFQYYLTETDVFAVDINGIVGWASIATLPRFSDDLTADCKFFYVMKGARGTGVSRLLQSACHEFAKSKGARIILACGSSGVEDGLWINLFRKAGFSKLGTVMAKVL